MLTSAFDTATAGLQATQLAIGVASQNIANAGAAGYVKRSLTLLPAGPGNAGVAVGAVNRLFEEAALTQLRLETSRAAATALKADVLSEVDKLYGKPGDAIALDGRLSAFTQALQGLASNPASGAVRGTVLNTASLLADQIRGIAGRVQELRSGLENRLGADVTAANGLLKSIASLNLKASAATDDTMRAGLLDQRDQQISQLSSYLDVRPIMQRDGTATLMTTSGVMLVERGAATTLSFDGRGALGPASAFATDPAKRGVGTITATLPGGGAIDLGGRDALRSGSIAAALELRDVALPQSQRRLDDLAAGLAQALTDKSIAAAPNGGGFDLGLTELARLKPGNTITLAIDSGGGVRNVVLVASTQASRALDAGQTVDANAKAQTFTIPPPPATAQDFATALSTALAAVAPGLTATASAGTVTLSGSGLQGASAVVTQPKSAGDVSGAYPRLALFVDGAGNTLVTGSLDGAPQRVGLAQRLSLNAALRADSSPLAAVGPTPAGPGPARPQYLYDALTSGKQMFASAGGQAPISTTVVAFTQDMVAAEGAAAAAAKTIDERQGVVLGTTQGWFAKGAGVNVDEEMARLVTLQTAYAANARLLSVVREMLDTLLKS